MSFSEYNTVKAPIEMRYPQGVYISVELMEESVLKVKQYMDVYLPNTEVEDPHCTIIYSTTPMDVQPITKQYKTKAVFDGFELFGENKDVLVVKLLAPKIVYRNSQLVSKYGFTSDWGTYKPHFTLKWNVGKDFDMSSLAPFDFDLYFHKETVERLNPIWGK